MRIGEILGLHWGDVDLDRAQILVRSSKNGEPRHVGMNGLLVDTIRQLQRRPQNPYGLPMIFGTGSPAPWS